MNLISHRVDSVICTPKKLSIAMMALDHRRLGLENKFVEKKSGRIVCVRGLKSLKRLVVVGPCFLKQCCFGLYLGNQWQESMKVGKQLDVPCRLKNILSFRTKLRLSNSFIMSLFHYCSSIWHHCLKSDSKKTG